MFVVNARGAIGLGPGPPGLVAEPGPDADGGPPEEELTFVKGSGASRPAYGSPFQFVWPYALGCGCGTYRWSRSLIFRSRSLSRSRSRSCSRAALRGDCSVSAIIRSTFEFLLEFLKPPEPPLPGLAAIPCPTAGSGILACDPFGPGPSSAPDAPSYSASKSPDASSSPSLSSRTCWPCLLCAFCEVRPPPRRRACAL